MLSISHDTQKSPLLQKESVSVEMNFALLGYNQIQWGPEIPQK